MRHQTGIEAAINWKKRNDRNQQRIKLTTINRFYSTEIPKVSGATVSIKKQL
jgi:hypothetical protein